MCSKLKGLSDYSVLANVLRILEKRCRTSKSVPWSLGIRFMGVTARWCWKKINCLILVQLCMYNSNMGTGITYYNNSVSSATGWSRVQSRQVLFKKRMCNQPKVTSYLVCQISASHIYLLSPTIFSCPSCGICVPEGFAGLRRFLSLKDPQLICLSTGPAWFSLMQ